MNSIFMFDFLGKDFGYLSSGDNGRMSRRLVKSKPGNFFIYKSYNFAALYFLNRSIFIVAS